jgi:hypothetical protein
VGCWSKVGPGEVGGVIWRERYLNPPLETINEVDGGGIFELIDDLRIRASIGERATAALGDGHSRHKSRKRL